MPTDLLFNEAIRSPSCLVFRHTDASILLPLWIIFSHSEGNPRLVALLLPVFADSELGGFSSSLFWPGCGDCRDSSPPPEPPEKPGSLHPILSLFSGAAQQLDRRIIGGPRVAFSSPPRTATRNNKRGFFFSPSTQINQCFFSCLRLFAAMKNSGKLMVRPGV